MATISRVALDALAIARARTVASAVVYDGEVDASLDGLSGQRTTPPMLPHASRVAPHAVFYPARGAQDPEEPLCLVDESIVWQFQLTCVGGYRADAQALADRMNALFLLWVPPVSDGLSAGPLRPPLGYNPPVIAESSATGARYSIPLQYATTIGR